PTQLTTPSLHDALPISAALSTRSGCLRCHRPRRRPVQERGQSYGAAAFSELHDVGSTTAHGDGRTTIDHTHGLPDHRVVTYELRDRKSTRLNSSHVKIS